MHLSKNNEKKFRVKQVHQRHGACRGPVRIVVVQHDDRWPVVLQSRWYVLLRVASCWTVLLRVAPCCCVLLRVAVRGSVVDNGGPYCDAVLRTAVRCAVLL